MQWFMQDGVMLHTANFMLDLNTFFGSHIMSNSYPDQHNCGNFWPHTIPDLNPCDFFLRGFLKEVFVQKQSIELEMTRMLALLCRGAEEDLCCHVIANMLSASRGYSKEWWPHQAHTDKKKNLYTDAEQYVKSW